MKRLILILLTAAGVFCTIPETRAEPVSMVVLAPVALEAAKQASPYVITALQNGGRQLLEVGKDLGNILRLPLGVIQITLGLPFGMLGNGLDNLTVGFFAPFQLIGDILILPVSFLGVGGG